MGLPRLRISTVSPWASHLERRPKSLRNSRTLAVFMGTQLSHQAGLSNANLPLAQNGFTKARSQGWGQPVPTYIVWGAGIRGQTVRAPILESALPLSFCQRSWIAKPRGSIYAG